MEGSQPFFGSQNMISLSSFRLMTQEERWALVKGGKTRVNPSNFNIKTCKPDFIAPLYTNTPFPHFPEMEGTTQITLSDDNIYDGVVVYKINEFSVHVTWKGYTTQLYDGTLKMCPVNHLSTIEGVWNGIFYFKFTGSTFEHGVWPGFIELY